MSFAATAGALAISALLVSPFASVAVHVSAFAPVGTVRCAPKSFRRYDTSLGPTSLEQEPQPPSQVLAVVAPLKYLGPSNYPALELLFPDHQITQDDGSVQQTSLEFIMDTGANINTVDGAVVDFFDLPVAISAEELGAQGLQGAAGMGGTLPICDIHTLGTCKLGGMPPETDFEFMYGLTAAKMPSLPAGVGNGLLGLTFFMSFPAGVEMDWYGTNGDPPTVIFYYGTETPKESLENMVCVPLERLSVGIMALNVNVNGVDMKAILDTGAPYTILSPDAAYRAGIETYAETMERDDLPLRQQVVGATGTGIDGGKFKLDRSVSDVSITVGGASLGETPVFVGELPGMAVLGELGMESPPQAILGLDFMQRAYRLVIKISDDSELWIEELGDQPRWDGQRGYNES